MQRLFRINSRNIPPIYDKNTIYGRSAVCSECDSSETTIERIGAYLPTFKHTFGLINPLGGIIASKEATHYLRDNDLNGFTIEEALVTFGERESENEQYFWIKPTEKIELDAEKGPGPVVDCDKCGRRMWNENEGINILKSSFSSDLILVNHTWITLCSERFMEVAKKVPNKCYLSFEEWNYSIKD
ncbi:hypothetical protein V7146_05000 [Gottfriedia acidiceleris]|uniref:hypothetical protein n=1 Tax=Gottfriedia acidiceleris TaxID=371036 RepID=UPI002FFF72AA